MTEVKKNASAKLTKRQEFFCRNYVANGHDGKKAAEDAGYSKKTAYSIANENLNKPELKQFINELEKPVLDKLGVDENWVLTKLKRFSEANIMDFFELKTQRVSTGRGKNKKVTILQNLELKDLNNLPGELTDCIQEISQTAHGIRLKLVEKRSSVEDIGKSLGMFKNQIEGNFKHNVENKVYVVPAFGSSGVNDNPEQPG